MRRFLTSSTQYTLFALASLILMAGSTELEAKKPKVGVELPPPVAIEVKVNDELDAIHNLIERTETNLYKQKELEALISRYREEQALFMKKDDSSKRLVAMVTLSKRIQRQLREQHLEALFSEQFLQELAVFSQMGRSEDR